MPFHIQHPIPIPMEDPIVHTAEHPICGIDPTCPCSEDQEALATLAQQVQEGLLTAEEATNYVLGKML